MSPLGRIIGAKFNTVVKSDKKMGVFSMVNERTGSTLQLSSVQNRCEPSEKREMPRMVKTALWTSSIRLSQLPTMKSYPAKANRVIESAYLHSQGADVCSSVSNNVGIFFV